MFYHFHQFGRFASLKLAFLLLVPAAFSPAQQQPPTPQLISVFPVGGKAGTIIKMKILAQTELEFAEKLLFSHPGITAKPQFRESSRFHPKPTRLRNAFTVTIAGNVPPGTYDVRGVCDYGVSNPRRFVVTQTAEHLESEPNDQPHTANPISSNSTVNGVFETGYDFFKFNARQNESLVVRCISEQIDSIGDPVITIFDPAGNIVAKNHDTIGRDALASFLADQNGEYLVRVNDLTFVSQGGQGTAPYRLSVSPAPWIDFVDPPVLQAGSSSKIKLYGRNLGGALSGFQRNGQELEVIEMPLTTPTNVKTTNFATHKLLPNQFYGHRFTYRHQNKKGISNPVLIDLVDRGIITEESLKKSGGTLPRLDSEKNGVEMLGQFSEPGEPDHFRFKADQGEQFWIEVISQRMGIQTDPLLQIESIQLDKQGKEVFRTLTSADDYQPLASPFRIRVETDDPAILFEAPKEGDYRITVLDQFNLPTNFNGPNYYRLRFRRPSTTASLIAIPGLERGQNDNNSRALKITPCIVRKNSAAEIQVIAYRNPGFKSAITIKAEGLPKGVTCEPIIMGEKQSHATLLLRGSANLTAGHSRVNIVATTEVDNQLVAVPVAHAEVTSNSVGNDPSDSRLTNDIMVATDPTIDYPGVIKFDKRVIETARGGKVESKASLVKNPQFKGTVQQAFLHGMPRQINRNTNNLADSGADVTYKLDFRQDVPPGSYTGFLRGYIESSVPRCEKQFQAVTEEQKRISTLQQQIEKEFQAATRLRQGIEQKLAQLKRQATTLRSQKSTTQQTTGNSQRFLAEATKKQSKLASQVEAASATAKSLTQMATAETDAEKKKAATEKLTVANSTLSKLKQEMATAATALTAAQAALDKNNKMLDDLQKKIDQNNTESQKLVVEIEKEKEAEIAIQADRTLGQNLKREIDQELQMARQASQKRNRRFLVYSDPILVRVADVPVKIQIKPATLKLKQGDSTKFQVTVQRLYDFKGEMKFRLEADKKGNGRTLKPNATLKANENSAEFEFLVQSTAEPGHFSDTLVGQFRFGNTNLEKKISFEVDVLPVEKK
jgi:hypothetical protein